MSSVRVMWLILQWHVAAYILPDSSMDFGFRLSPDMVTKWPYSLLSELILGAPYTVFRAGSIGKGPGPKFGRKAPSLILRAL